jgi:hypothetical protein
LRTIGILHNHNDTNCANENERKWEWGDGKKFTSLIGHDHYLVIFLYVNNRNISFIALNSTGDGGKLYSTL